MIVKFPYKFEKGNWLKGNFHIHTTRSDGVFSPQDVINKYFELGYDFLSFSDHDVLITEKDYKLLDNKGLILIPGVEISASGVHLLYIDAAEEIYPDSSRQKVLNDIQAIFNKTGKGFAIINHPDWQNEFNHCSIEQMMEWTGYLGIEIYNGVIGRLDGNQYAINKWDILLSKEKKVWGFANDDSHRPGDYGLGWNVVFAEKYPESIIDAVRKGNFYCSTGIVIKHIDYDGNKIYLETENAKKIAAIQNAGRRFKVVYGNSINVEIPQDAKYVRFECWGDAEEMAWTQPIIIEEKEMQYEFDYVQNWLVSELLDISSLDHTSPEEGSKLAKRKILCQPSKTVLAGFVDIREISNSQKGIIYLVADARFESDSKAILSLGYDGPVRVWVNEKEVFYGPGTNPAIRDQTKVFTNVKKGNNRIVVALDTNGGKAWGIFCRIKDG
ncbi:MAG: hypothetical protein NC831_03920 [Candidatus Omnitrophica bacterium]|nr:hypothetical protein [Candidatus Omnitrophota bacterium]